MPNLETVQQTVLLSGTIHFPPGKPKTPQLGDVRISASSWNCCLAATVYTGRQWARLDINPLGFELVTYGYHYEMRARRAGVTKLLQGMKGAAVGWKVDPDDPKRSGYALPAREWTFDDRVLIQQTSIEASLSGYGRTFISLRFQDRAVLDAALEKLHLTCWRVEIDERSRIVTFWWQR